MTSGEITYKTLKQAKIAYAIAGWSVDLEEENLVIVSKEKNRSHIIHAIVTILTVFLFTKYHVFYEFLGALLFFNALIIIFFCDLNLLSCT